MMRRDGGMFARANRRRTPGSPAGLSLIELVFAVAILVVTVSAFLQTYFSQEFLNGHLRNTSWAMLDAQRVVDQLRQENSGTGCTTPGVLPPAGFASWNAWLADVTMAGAGGMNVMSTTQVDGFLPPPSVVPPAGPGDDPLAVVVAVCWRYRGRVVGECRWNGAQLVSQDQDADGVIESPAMISTTLTCRS